jgi:hypothetical protein
MPNPVFEMLREYPASLAFPIGATSIAYLALKAFRPTSTRELPVAMWAIWLGSAAGFVAAFLYVYSHIDGWAVLLAPFLLGPILFTSVITGAILVSASSVIRTLARLTKK